MNLENYIALVSGVITIISVAFNIIQFRQGIKNNESLKAHMQANFNMFYQIGRALTKVRHEHLALDEENVKMLKAMENIRGIADAARSSIISYSREVLNFVPEYEHPAFPGKKMSEQVMLGTEVEKEE